MKYELYLIINEELFLNNYIDEEEYIRINEILYKKIKNVSEINAIS